MAKANVHPGAGKPTNMWGSKTGWMWTLVALLIGVGLHSVPLVQSDARQDDCTFGPVSNERYRQLLSEAKQKIEAWRPLPWRNNGAEKLLQSRFDDLSRSSNSVYERIAAMHAVMRALGAEYRRTGWGGDDPYQAALNGASLVPFNYHLDVNRLGYFRPIWREIWLMGVLAVKDAKGPFLRPVPAGEVMFTVWFPEFIETYVLIPRSKSGEACPLVPPPSLAVRLD